jgi:hypothetical protein
MTLLAVSELLAPILSIEVILSLRIFESVYCGNDLAKAHATASGAAGSNLK